MSEKKLETVSKESARRLLLDAQGLLEDPARKLTAARLRDAIEELGFVQIDSINVISRAHHLTLWSRFDEYRPELLAKLLEDRRELFEHWTHDASAIPMKWFPHWRHRFDRHRERIEANKWWRERRGADFQAVMERFLRRITDEGAVLANEFTKAEPKRGAKGGWWSWSPTKAALEHMWHTGTLGIAKRINFQKVYDLLERVIPDRHRAEASSHEAHVEWACSTALERLGVATPLELAAYWRAIDLSDAAAWCKARAAEGAIVEVAVEGGRNAYAVRDWKKRAQRARVPTTERIRLLSPFDPIVRDRKRMMRLFDFDYSFEAFVPAPKRKYGYYVLPMLEGDRLIGRIEPKLDRDANTVRVLGVWWEKGVKPTKQRKKALAETLERLAKLTGVDKVSGQ